MVVFQVGKDFETSERAGAAPMFQVDTLLDEEENNITDRIDCGIHFRNDNHLKGYLSEIFKIAVDDIYLEDL